MKIKKGDNVIVLAGQSKGKTGKVLRAIPSEDKVVVEGANMRKVFVRSKKGKKTGEMVEKFFPIHISNVKKHA